jgi:hypothetical protein
MSDFNQFETQRRRLAILAVLSFSGGYRMPLRSIRDQVEQIGYAASPDRIATDCAWLAEQDQLTIDNGVANLSERGKSTVEGWSVTPGISRPTPGEVADMKRSIVQAGIAAAQAALRGE